MNEPIETIITASFTGKISTASYENSSPFFSLTEKYDCGFTDEELSLRHKELSRLCTDKFNQVAERLHQERIAKLYENIRFYPVGELQYPSVTSLFMQEFALSPDEMAQYAARGTIFHKQAEIYWSTGEWKEPKNIPEVYPEWLIMTQGNLGLTLEGFNLVACYKDYPFKVIDQEQVVYNHEYKYAGRYDVRCVIESANKGKWDKIEGVLYDVPTILDLKTGSIDETKCFKQGTAYAKCCDDVKQIGVLPVNDKTKQGFSKPLVCSAMDTYWSLFKKDREQFRKVYGI